jgi:catechol 2,3-dioxygenase-like lactoylglutathione lyase family enzyme
MPNIRHIGITTRDPARTGAFMKEAFGLIEVSSDPDNESMVLSDGYINVTLLRFQYDRYGGGTPGLHHFGVHVEDLDQAESKLAELGAEELTFWNQTYGNAEGTPDNWVGEKKFMSPEGLAMDINPSGWQIRAGGPRGE